MKIYAPTARAARRVERPRSDAAPDSAPANFDLATCPIIARHFFGVEPLRPIGDVAGVVVADLKRLRQVEDLHRLGPRAIGEMLREAANGKDLDRALGTYERLTASLLKALGGRRFPPFPIPEAQAIVKALGGTWHGSYGTARCPAHDDREPSLSVRDRVDGEPVFNCFAGCNWRNIKDALRVDGLLPERGPDPDPGRGDGRAARWRRRWPPGPAKPRTVDINQQQRMEFARRKWHEAVPLTGSPAEAYLRERGLEPRPNGWPPSLRYHFGLKHGPTGLHLPALLGAVAIWPGQEVVGLHRTFLRADGKGKAPVTTPKMMIGRCGGGAVRLAPAGPELVLSEGIETGLSVQQAVRLPVWATLSTSGLRSVILPPEVETVVVAADGDEGGEEAAQAAARRFIAEGRKVKIARPPQGMDFNDLLLKPENVIPFSTVMEAAHD